MRSSQSPRGVLSPVVTPFTADLRPDVERLLRHCQWLLDNDVGLAVFGTNSEANSLTVAEKWGCSMRWSKRVYQLPA